MKVTLSMNPFFFLHCWQDVNHEGHFNKPPPPLHVTNWEKPPAGTLKLNMDVTLDRHSGMMGFGFILKNSDRDFITTKSLPMKGFLSFEESEDVGVKEALSWLKEIFMDSIIVEMDSLHVFNEIYSVSSPSSFGLIVSDIKEIAMHFIHLNFLFVKRSANQVAHTLARHVVSLSGCMEWFSIPPFILDVLRLD